MIMLEPDCGSVISRRSVANIRLISRLPEKSSRIGSRRYSKRLVARW